MLSFWSFIGSHKEILDFILSKFLAGYLAFCFCFVFPWRQEGRKKRNKKSDIIV